MTFSPDRCIGQIQTAAEGFAIAVVAGQHGNEPAGIYACEQLLLWLQSDKNTFKGKLACFKGNVAALTIQQRYIDWDLNRLWSPENLAPSQTTSTIHELQELRALHMDVTRFWAETPLEKRVLIDLHSTSGPANLFIAADKTAQNKKLLVNSPFPVVFGIENFISGGMISHFSAQGYTAIACEGGQHSDPETIQRHLDFLIWSLQNLGVNQNSSLEKQNNSFKIVFRYAILPGEHFKMLPNLSNFMPVVAGQVLANNQENAIVSPFNGFLFLPLYQSQGSDGFFIIEPINN